MLLEDPSDVSRARGLEVGTSGRRRACTVLAAPPGRATSMIILTILGWIVFGLIVGFIARALVPGKDDIGILPTIGLGILGSVVGGLLGSLLFAPHQLSFKSPVGWIGSLLVAVIPLLLFH